MIVSQQPFVIAKCRMSLMASRRGRQGACWITDCCSPRRTSASRVRGRNSGGRRNGSG